MVFCETPAVPEVEPIEEEAPNEVQFNVEDLQIIEAKQFEEQSIFEAQTIVEEFSVLKLKLLNS